LHSSDHGDTLPESRVLFLDFDGVLHAVDEPPLNGGGRLMANPRLFAWRPVLEDILAPYPKVRIIVSSDWRRLLDDDNLKRALGPLAPRFTGVVERWCASRVDEILTKARRRKLTTWLAVDDHPTVVAASRRDVRFIACESDTGLSALPVQARLRAALTNLVDRL
jgi:HAD domain in Swiss Army Knife RNA repair proteins